VGGWQCLKASHDALAMTGLARLATPVRILQCGKSTTEVIHAQVFNWSGARFRRLRWS
jgi:hypothetical protein